MRHVPTPRTPEQQALYLKREAARQASTDAALLAGIEAAERGEDVSAAMQAHHAAVRANRHAGGAVPAVDPAAVTAADAPRIRDADGWNEANQRAFLLHLAQGGCVSHACEAVGLSRQSAYALRRRHPNSVFAVAWDVAIDMARQALLDEATERAIRGREQPVWYHGEQVGTRIVHNDRLLIFLLSRTPEPANPRLTPRELQHLFPSLLRMIDVILPPDFSPARIAEITGDGEEDDED